MNTVLGASERKGGLLSEKDLKALVRDQRVWEGSWKAQSLRDGKAPQLKEY